MPKQDTVPTDVPKNIILKRIKSIRKLDKSEDVYCLSAYLHRNMIANGILTKNCDALRYVCLTAFGNQLGSQNRMTVEDVRALRRKNAIF